jgi:hypothetical protein
MDLYNLKNYEKYYEYLRLKNSFNIKYKDVPIKNFLAWDLINIAFNDNLGFDKNMLYLPFMRLNIKNIHNNYLNFKTIFFQSVERKDHIDLVNEISKNLNDSIIIKLFPHKRSIKFPILLFFKSLFIICKNSSIKKYHTSIKLYLVFKLTYYLLQLKLLNKYNYPNVDEKKIITVNSSVGIDSLITLFFKAKNINTYHIFHGIFGRYKKMIVTDIINGENITAKYILAFSNVQRNDMIIDFNINPESIFVLGNAKYPFKQLKFNNNFKKCLILTGTIYYDVQSLELIQILNTFGPNSNLSFYFKPHPSSKILKNNKLNTYKNICVLNNNTTLKELLNTNQFDFAITSNTFSYYETLYYDLITFRYSKDENIDFIGLKDKFYDQNSLMNLIKEFSTMNLLDYSREVERLLIEVLGMGINNFRILNYLNRTRI